MRDLHLWEIEKALIAHVAFTTAEEHFRAVFFLYAIIPIRDKINKVFYYYVVYFAQENICSSLKRTSANYPGWHTTLIRVNGKKQINILLICIAKRYH